MAIPAVPTSSKGLLPARSIKYIAIKVKRTVTELNRIPDEKAASVPIPVCLKIEVA